MAASSQAAERPREALLPGFGELFRKELMEARRSKRIIIFALIMTFALALVPIVGAFNIDDYGSGPRIQTSENDRDSLLGTWAGIVAYLGSIMVIASTVDAVARERTLGVTAWIITKPVSRVSYMVAKAAAHSLISALTVVLIPTATCMVLMVALFDGIEYEYVLWATAILLVEVAFLTLCMTALGVPLNAVMWIALLGLGLWFIPVAAPVFGEDVYRVLPSYLPLAAILATNPDYAGDSEVFTITIASVAVAGLVFLASLLVFERQEL
jgi:ABC-2 type transport system permease protein